MTQKIDNTEKEIVLKLIENESKLSRKAVRWKILKELGASRALHNTDNRISEYLSNIKRKSSYNYYLQDLRPFNIFPGDITTAEIKQERGEDWKPTPIFQDSSDSEPEEIPTPIKTEEDKVASMDPSFINSFSKMNTGKSSNTPKTPPRNSSSSNRAIPPPVSFSTPPRKSTPASKPAAPVTFPPPAFTMEDATFDAPTPTTFSTEDSSNLDLENQIGQQPGAYYNPHIFFFTHQGCSMNGFQVYLLQKLCTNDEYYKGFFIMKHADPAEVLSYTAEVVDKKYITNLLGFSRISIEESAMEAILFKEKMHSTGDSANRVGIQFPHEETKKQIEEEQACVTEDSPLFYRYTLLMINMGNGKFDNRVFSNHEKILEPYPSLPPAEDAEFTGRRGDKELIWHGMWQIAIQGTGKPLNQKLKKSIQDLIRERG